MARRRLFAIPNLGPNRKQFTRTRTTSAKPATTGGTGMKIPSWINQKYAGVAEDLKRQAFREAKAIGRKGIERTFDTIIARMTGSGALAPIVKSLGKSRGSKNNTRQYATALTANGSISQSSTYFGRIPKMKIVNSSRYVYGTFRDVSPVDINLGDTVTDYGKQLVTTVNEVGNAAELNLYADTLKNNAWQSWKTQIVKAEGSLTFNNNDIANGMVDIYECVARSTMNQSAFNAWETGANDISVNYTTTDLGTTPYNVPGFNKLWKVIKRTTVPLSPGCTHTHVYRYGGFRPVTPAELPVNDNYVRGMSFNTFFVVRGTPIRTAGAIVGVSTSTPIISVVVTRIVTARVVDNTAPLYVENNNLSTLTLAEITLREEDGDVVVGAQGPTREN